MESDMQFENFLWCQKIRAESPFKQHAARLGHNLPRQRLSMEKKLLIINVFKKCYFKV